MQTGPFFSGTIMGPGGPTQKGLVVKLGDHQDATLCYDTDLLRVSAGWSGGFLNFSPARYGLISPPGIPGQADFVSPLVPGVSPSEDVADPRPRKPYGPLPPAWAKNKGLWRHGNRTVLSYTIGETEILESPWAYRLDVGTKAPLTIYTRIFVIFPSKQSVRILLHNGQARSKILQPISGVPKQVLPQVRNTPDSGSWLEIPAKDEVQLVKVALWKPNGQADPNLTFLIFTPDLREWAKPALRMWPQVLETTGTRAADNAPYVVDTLTLPLDNPYKALFFLSGLDFFPDGTAAVCTAHGDVWLVRGIDDSLQKITWQRFATGLFQPLGLKIVDGKIHVLGRDQITRLHDVNNDGEADFYENFNNGGQVTTNGHEFATCLETDSQGWFYYLRGDSGSATEHDGSLLRVSPDGRKLEVFASGFRNANGLGIGPRDEITVAPQEGNWTPASGIFQVRASGFYGAMQSHHRPVAPTTFEPPLCWIPRRLDNSSGGQTWVTSDQWGPLQGGQLHFSFGTCRMFHVVREQVGDRLQGATVQWPLDFDSGIMRGKFHPVDGQLYVVGLRGWVSSAVQDGCFQRVRHTGQPVHLPSSQKTYRNGIQLTFTAPLDKDAAEATDSYRVEAWNYRWSAQYGSPDLKPSQPEQMGRDELEVLSATLVDDRTVFLELPPLQPVGQLVIEYSLKTSTGESLEQAYNATLHVIPQENFPEERIVRRPIPGDLPPEKIARLQPGLLGRYESLAIPSQVAVSTSRMAAGWLEPSESPTWTIPKGAWQGRLIGYLKVPRRGEYRLRLIGTGKAQLHIGEYPPLSGALSETGLSPEPLALRRGYLPLEIAYQPSESGPAQWRLLWEGPDFTEEAVPPTQLFHEPSLDAAATTAKLVHEGRQLFLESRCWTCHQVPGDGALSRDLSSLQVSPAPSLTKIGERYTAEWLAAWIANPQACRSQANMPRFFSEKPTAQEQAQIADLVAALMAAGSSADVDFTGTPEKLALGEGLFETLGCIGCHRLEDGEQPDVTDRISLAFISNKFRPGKITEFLRAPTQFHPRTRMPDFRLSPTEAQGLEAHLRQATKGELSTEKSFPGDAQQGMKRLFTLGCVNCHALNETPPKGPFLSAPSTDPRGVCFTGLGGKNARGQTIPRYPFDESQQVALRTFLATASTSLHTSAPLEDLPARLRNNRCQACHARDQAPARVPALVAEEGSGLPTESLPHLTWVGDKFRTSWLDGFLQGKIPHKPRPWLKARMPTIAEHEDLARQLAAEHGLPPQELPASIDPRLVEVGERLTTKLGGLDCRQCHGVGSQLPQGDHATQLALGINFSLAKDRLRPDFYNRMVLDPYRYDPNSRMPRFAPDGRKTPITNILNGDARAQFHAIWQYLQTCPDMPGE